MTSPRMTDPSPRDPPSRPKPSRPKPSRPKPSRPKTSRPETSRPKTSRRDDAADLARDDRASSPRSRCARLRRVLVAAPRHRLARRDQGDPGRPSQALAPFLYENSEFYRRRFDRLGLAPSDLRTVDDLIAKWPVVDKLEMAEDAAAQPPYGTYNAMTDAILAERGWMMFSSSGTTGAPRVFRYSHLDRELWAWANARALQAMDFRNGDTVFMITGYGPHVWAWARNAAPPRCGCRRCPAAAWMRRRAPTS